MRLLRLAAGLLAGLVGTAAFAQDSGWPSYGRDLGNQLFSYKAGDALLVFAPAEAR